MEKYYTPDLSEFRIGFKYEYFVQEPNFDYWAMCIFPQSDSTFNMRLNLSKRKESEPIDTFILREYITDPTNREREWDTTKDIGWVINNVQNTRVKYLDREDIESCGLKYNKTHGGLNEDCFDFSDKEHYMDYDYDEHYCRIAMSGEGDVTRFSGTIKNISELKQIMKMLNIE